MYIFLVDSQVDILVKYYLVTTLIFFFAKSGYKMNI